MVTKEDKALQAQVRIESALRKRELARVLLASAERELYEARRFMEGGNHNGERM